MLFALTTTSCNDIRFGEDFLEQPPTAGSDINEVYANRVNAMQALTTVYTSLPDGLVKPSPHLMYNVLESLSDLNSCSMSWASVRESYYTGKLSSSTKGNENKYNFVDGGFTGVRDAWLFIENVGRVPDMTPEEMEVRKAEAKMIVAIHYADMLRHFGGLPWVDRVYKPSEIISLPRLTAEETVNNIVALLDEVALVLPWSITDPIEDGRMTKAAAMGLKVRVLLFAASPIFNDTEPYMSGEAVNAKCVWYGDKQMSRWDRVVTACEEFEQAVATNGVYSLVDTGNPRADFQNAYFKRANGEVLISTRKRAKYWSGIWVKGTTFETMNYGTGNTTLDYVDMFPRTDGEDFDWNNPVHAANPFFNDPAAKKPNRDPRLYESVLINQDKYKGKVADTWIGGKDRKTGVHDKAMLASGFLMRKFRLDVTSMVNQIYSWPHLRLAEVYLSYAEALNEVGRTAEAYEYVNKIRARVDMPNIKPNLSIPEFREQVLRERALEFGYEEVRFFDLVRWKRVGDFSKKLRGLDIRKKGKKFTYEVFELPQARAWQGAGWDTKWYFSAFPQSEINKEYGLIQNPGW